MISISNLSFSYKSSSKKTLSDISFSIGKGEMVCLFGPNGSGKSTVIKCLIGKYKLPPNTVLWDGEDINDISVAKLSSKVSYIPQKIDIPFSYTALDTVLMGTMNSLKFYETPSTVQYERAMNALKTLNLSDYANRPVSELSGGEAQLIMTARALCQNAGTFILDEPTASLDYGNRYRSMSVLKELSAQGYTIIFSCHDPLLIKDFASRVIVLSEGTLVSDGAPRDILNDELINKLFKIERI